MAKPSRATPELVPAGPVSARAWSPATAQGQSGTNHRKDSVGGQPPSAATANEEVPQRPGASANHRRRAPGGSTLSTIMHNTSFKRANCETSLGGPYEPE